MESTATGQRVIGPISRSPPKQSREAFCAQVLSMLNQSRSQIVRSKNPAFLIMTREAPHRAHRETFHIASGPTAQK